MLPPHNSIDYCNRLVHFLGRFCGSVNRAKPIAATHHTILGSRLRNEDLVIRAKPHRITLLFKHANYLKRDTTYLDGLSDEERRCDRVLGRVRRNLTEPLWNRITEYRYSPTSADFSFGEVAARD